MPERVGRLPNAAKVVADVRRSLAGIEGVIRRHPFLDALERGALAEDSLRAFPGHEYQMVRSDLESLQTLHRRFESGAAASFFLALIEGEKQALTNIIRLGARLGMSEEELRGYEVSARGFAYAAYLSWLSLNASAAEFAGAILLNFDAWGTNCGRMSLALQRRYGFAPADTAFLDAFASLPSFEPEALTIIQEGLDQGVEPALIARSARLLQGYEKMFWDAMALAAGLDSALLL